MLPKLMTLSLCCAEGAKLAPWGRTYPLRLEADPETDLLGFDELDWLDIEDTPETDLFSEKHEDIGVGSRFGEDEVGVSRTVVVTSSSAAMADAGWQWPVDTGRRTSMRVTMCRIEKAEIYGMLVQGSKEEAVVVEV
jgi:hypothetical protein